MGDRLHNLQQAYELIEGTVNVILRKSSIYETAAWGFTEQEPFLNQVLCVSSTLAPHELLLKLLSIELQLGRKRAEKNGPRIIDIDILLYGDQIISERDLIVPHPRMADRRFVLTPLNEIAPDFVHPVFNKTISLLLSECQDSLELKRYMY